MYYAIVNMIRSWDSHGNAIGEAEEIINFSSDVIEASDVFFQIRETFPKMAEQIGTIYPIFVQVMIRLYPEILDEIEERLFGAQDAFGRETSIDIYRQDDYNLLVRIRDNNLPISQLQEVFM